MPATGPTEYEQFDLNIKRRPSLMEEGVEVLKQAWTGEPFEWRGHEVRILPRPAQEPRPAIALGGSSPASAKRAARIADDFQPVVPKLYDIYLEELATLGKPVPEPRRGGRGGGMFFHIAEDPDRAWEQIAPHAMHETNDYAEWATGMRGSPYTSFDSSDELRKSGMYEIVTPDDRRRPHSRAWRRGVQAVDGRSRPRDRVGVAAPVRVEGLAALTRVERVVTDGVRWMFHATAMGPSYDAILEPLARLFGCRVLHDNEVSTPGVERRGGMTWIADNSIEIGQPLGESSPVRRFLERFGGGMHSVAVQVADLDVALERAERVGVRVASRIDEGLAFTRPGDTAGLLIEWYSKRQGDDPRWGAPEPPFVQ